MHARRVMSGKASSEKQKQVLRKAIIRVAEELQISRQELSCIIGFSEASLSRVFNNADYFIDPAANEGRLSLLLIRMYRSLDALFGGNAEQCRLWLRSHNRHLQVVPHQLIQSIEGLVTTINYLDAMRGKN